MFFAFFVLSTNLDKRKLDYVNTSILDPRAIAMSWICGNYWNFQMIFISGFIIIPQILFSFFYFFLSDMFCYLFLIG